MAVAQNSNSYWWLGWVTLVPLFLAIRTFRPGPALAAGAFWGVSLYSVSGLLGGGSIPQTTAALLLLAIIPAAYTCLGSIVTRRKGFHPFLLGLGWAGVEIALQPLALRTGLLAGTLGDSVWVLTLGKMGGYVLVAFLVAFANAALLSILSGVRLRIPRPRVVIVPPDHNRTLPSLEDVVFSFLFLQPIHPRHPPA